MKRQPEKFQKSLFYLYLCLQKRQQMEGGYSLVVTIAMLIILSTLLISAAIISKVDTISTNASAKSNIGFMLLKQDSIFGHRKLGRHLRALTVLQELHLLHGKTV